MITCDIHDDLTIQPLDSYVKVVSPEQYVKHYNEIVLANPSMFSITLADEYYLLMTSFPKGFGVEFKDVINAACYYYGDIDPVRSIIDDFVRPESIEQYLADAILVTKSEAIATAYLETTLLILKEAIVTINRRITMLMEQVMAVAIEGIGANYTVTAIIGPTVMFKRLIPSEVISMDHGDTSALLISVSDFMKGI